MFNNSVENELKDVFYKRQNIRVYVSTNYHLKIIYIYIENGWYNIIIRGKWNIDKEFTYPIFINFVCTVFQEKSKFTMTLQLAMINMFI